MQYKVILFDGICNLCNCTVNFIIKRDKKQMFRYVTLQSDYAKHMLDKADKSKVKGMDSILLFEKGNIYYKSTAALKIAKVLPGSWKLFYAFIVIPVPLRDIIYDYIAKNRYKWFGKKQECMIPTEEIKELFLDW